LLSSSWLSSGRFVVAFYWTRRHFDPHPTPDMAKKSKRKQRREAPDPFPDDLLGPLMRTLPDVFESEVLSKLTWLDAYKIACVNRVCRETMEDIEAVLFMRTDGHEALEDPLDEIEDFHVEDHYYYIGSLMCHAAAGAGKLDILRWLRQHSCPWNEYSLEEAAACDHLDVMQWAIENGCPMNASVSHGPADSDEDNSLDTLKFLHKHGCPFDEDTCVHAVCSGQFEKLVWLRSPPINCPWDSGTTQFALRFCQWDTLKFALDNGCPYHPASRDTISTVASTMTARINDERETNSTKSED
jgi:hypothetical protein